MREIESLFYRITRKRLFGFVVHEDVGLLVKGQGEIKKFVRDFGNKTEIWYKQGATEVNSDHVIAILYDRD